ncbi:MAG: tRNA dihydrouridine synthase DusB, partial [Bacteroidetes bacterium]|nr:tRNA dihydrouridine synthase DusB [Bacteroidota bacterium]
DERVDTAIEHLSRAITWKGEGLGIIETRRHYGNYFRGFREIKAYRMKLVTSDSSAEIFDTLEEIRQRYKYEEV